jgi:hypothetical protein
MIIGQVLTERVDTPFILPIKAGHEILIAWNEEPGEDPPLEFSGFHRFLKPSGKLGDHLLSSSDPWCFNSPHSCIGTR